MTQNNKHANSKLNVITNTNVTKKNVSSLEDSKKKKSLQLLLLEF